MSLLVHLNPVIKQFKNMQLKLSGKLSLNTSQKVILLSMTAGLALLGALARYMRRKKQVVDPKKLKRSFNKRTRPSGIRSPNADLLSLASSGRRSNAYSNFSDRINARQSSIMGITSERASLASGSLVGTSAQIEGQAVKLTPQQLGVMGMESLEASINFWEDALAIYRSSDNGGPLSVLGPEEAGFCRDLQQLLDAAIELQEHSEMLFLDERSVLFRPSRNGIKEEENGIDTDLSGAESFASAQDQVADLREFEEFTELFPELESLPLYQEALHQLENTGIPYRTLRTELVKCGSDGEYLAKLHCLRLAFQQLLQNSTTYSFFVDSGRQILVDLLLFSDKDPKDFLIGYEEMLKYIQIPSNWRDIEDELSSKGVKALTFYDVVLDYILMDAFEDLDSPPSSVTAVIQNRWLSNGFKEIALTTAVWSVLKAKRKMLKYPMGFMAHFYTISEQLSPLMAWGFLGPDESLKETCTYFKEQVIGFLTDIFNFQKCKFTTIDELSVDVKSLLTTRVENICQKMSTQT